MTILPKVRQKDRLVCRIHHVSLSSTPFYEALSYAWGTSLETEDLLCVDDSTSSGGRNAKPDAVLWIRKTLYDALLARRNRVSARTLWADQVCINQKDVRDRNEQVRLMGRIYSNAKQVRIWLGPPQPDDALVNKSLKELIVKGYAQLGSDPATHMFFPKLKHGGWEALEAFLNRPWFSRVWILQEAILASKAMVAFGEFQYEWKVLVLALTTIRIFWQVYRFSKEPAALACVRTVLVIQALRKGTLAPAPHILHIAYCAQQQQAGDLRDKIYGMLGLSQHELDRLHFSPNYNRDTKQVFTDLVAHCLSSHNDPQFLSFVCPSTQDLPSWVPDWSAEPSPSQRMPGYHFAAATAQSLQWSLSDCRERLTLKGYLVGRPKVLGEALGTSGAAQTPPVIAFERMRTWLTATQTLAQQVPDPYTNGQSRAEAFKRLLTCDTDKLGKRPSAEALKPFDLMMRVYSQPFETAMRVTQKAALRVVAAFESDVVVTRSVGRRFCLLDDDLHFGWVPPQTSIESGDVVALFPGSTDLNVLRPVIGHTTEGAAAGEDHYRVVGMAYMHGMMHGEYLQGPGIELRDFCLE